MKLVSRLIARRCVVGTSGVLLTVFCLALAQVGTVARNVDYPFSGNNGSQRYSTLAQINAQNVNQLKEVWRYDLGGPAQIQNQPVVIDGVIYGMGLTKTYTLVAGTGKIKWEYDPPPIQGRHENELNERSAQTLTGNEFFFQSANPAKSCRDHPTTPSEHVRTIKEFSFRDSHYLSSENCFHCRLCKPSLLGQIILFFSV
jgi:quinoprotein glucose dehydrogenase